MAEGAERIGGGKLRRRAAMLMTGAALTGFYMWMQPAALGTLETNSAQAADGTGGCVMKVGTEEVRVHSRELCGTAPAPAALAPATIEEPAAEAPADLLRASVPVEAIRVPAPSANRFAAARPRVKPEVPALADASPEVEPREHTELVEDEDRWREEGSEHERGPEREERASFDGGEREYCDRDYDGGERHSGGGEGRH